MPARVGSVRRMELVTPEERRAMPDRCQDYWYRIAGEHYTRGHTVLDVGAGTGYGLDILREMGVTMARGIDPLPTGPEVAALDIAEVTPGAYGWVTCMDVIEHVDDDHGLLDHMLRVATQGVFLTTPNWNRFRAQNEFHLREYTPQELRALLADVPGRVELWAGGDTPREVPPVRTGWEGIEGASNFGVAIITGGPAR